MSCELYHYMTVWNLPVLTIWNWPITTDDLIFVCKKILGIPDNFEQCEYLWKFAIGCKQCKIILFTNKKDRLDLKNLKKG